MHVCFARGDKKAVHEDKRSWSFLLCQRFKHVWLQIKRQLHDISADVLTASLRLTMRGKHLIKEELKSNQADYNVSLMAHGVPRSLEDAL